MLPKSGNLEYDVYHKIAGLFTSRSGLKIVDRDWLKFTMAVKARMKALSIPKESLYLQKLITEHAGPQDEFYQLAAQVVNPESYFFRDKGHQMALSNTIFPRLIQARSSAKRLNIWSAGCSTGEETYSLAMVLTKVLPDWGLWKINLVGTDLNVFSISKAQKGLYRQNSLRDITPAELHKYFIKTGDQWLVNPIYRSMVKFHLGNLVEDMFPSIVSEFQQMDLILCRNVFIYFQPHVVAQVVAKFAKTLQPGGILLLGHGEAQVDPSLGLKSELIPGALIYKKL